MAARILPWGAENVHVRDVLRLALALVLPLGLLVWLLHATSVLTIDDAYITFRYARNLVVGRGLTYNAGERVEGYTNFSWTLLLALGLKLGASAEAWTKIVGAVCACATLVVTWLWAKRLFPKSAWVAGAAAWLLASSVPFAAHAEMGLETQFFALLIVGGAFLAVAESSDGARWPWSGVLLGVAGLTRPELPALFVLISLGLGRAALTRLSVLRAVAVFSIMAPHLLWRRFYYGAWIPNTVHAKTGDTASQLAAGGIYLENYRLYLGLLLWAGVVGAVTLLWKKRKEGGAVIVLLGAFQAAYAYVVGGDWMLLWRFLVPGEPYFALVIASGVGLLYDQAARHPAFRLIAALFTLDVVEHRIESATLHLALVRNEDAAWEKTAHETARWLRQNAPPGKISLGDIGFIGWHTDFPVLDVLGLVDTTIAKLPGAYTRKQGPKFVDHIFAENPRYIVIISGNNDCTSPLHPSMLAEFQDPRFSGFTVLHRVHHDGEVSWCTYERKIP